MKTVLMIDDRLETAKPGQSANRVHEIAGLLTASLQSECTVLAFDPDRALEYLREPHSVDLLIYNNHLQRGDEIAEEIVKREQPPKTIIFSAEPSFPGMLARIGIEGETFVPKWGEDFENLLKAVRLKLSD